MASELRVNTLKDASGNNSVATSVVSNGTAKAWINFNGTGTIATRGSFNVASIADEGVGAYQTNLTSATADANYAVTGSAGGSGTPSGCWHSTGFNANSYNTSNTTSSFHQQIYYTTSTIADVEFIYSSLNGDLA
jgi:hypothetical protein|tara:strand:- start:29 stop:433 length:405 start_codon:yes stop_codon:yes gene_type:complete